MVCVWGIGLPHTQTIIHKPLSDLYSTSSWKAPCWSRRTGAMSLVLSQIHEGALQKLGALKNLEEVCGFWRGALDMDAPCRCYYFLSWGLHTSRGRKCIIYGEQKHIKFRCWQKNKSMLKSHVKLLPCFASSSAPNELMTLFSWISALKPVGRTPAAGSKAWDGILFLNLWVGDSIQIADFPHPPLPPSPKKQN